MNASKTLATSLALVATLVCCTAFCDTSEIHETALDGDVAKVKALLKANPELVYAKDKDDWTPLHCAVQRDHEELVKIFLANKANINAKASASDGATPLHVAAAEGHKAMAEL